jgi:hypothetical protein
MFIPLFYIVLKILLHKNKFLLKGDFAPTKCIDQFFVFSKFFDGVKNETL